MVLIIAGIAAVVAVVAGFSGFCFGSLAEAWRPGGVHALSMERERLQERIETMRHRQERIADIWASGNGPLDQGATAEFAEIIVQIEYERRIACLDEEMDQHLRDQFRHGY